jgi:hypothetical protein
MVAESRQAPGAIVVRDLRLTGAGRAEYACTSLMKTWERDLLDHLVYLVINNAERPLSEDEVRDELKRELSRPRDRDAITPEQR